MSLFVSPLFTQSLLACSLAGALCGLIGSYLVWKRLGLMGDALAHASLPGAALALVMNWPLAYVLIPFSVLVSQLLAWLESRQLKQIDSFLAILFSGFFAMGVLILQVFGAGSHHVVDLLLGDILFLDRTDLLSLFAVFVIVAGYLLYYRKELLLMVLNSELALLEGVPVRRHGALLMALCGLTVATCLRLTGVVLLTSLMMVPPILAQTLTKTARGQFVISSILGVVIADLGLSLSFGFDLPIGPTIAVLGFLLFLVRVFFRP